MAANFESPLACPPAAKKQNQFPFELAEGNLKYAISLMAMACLIASTAAGADSSADSPDGNQPAASAWSAPEPWRTDRFYLATSLYTKHFYYNPDHDDHQNLIQGEWNVTTQWLAGLSLFNNSFGQPTQYLYGGYRFRPFDSVQPLYLKLTAGLVHGYKDQYQSKIPFNNAGVAPVIIPSLGYCVYRFCSEAIIFGAAGLMVTFGVTLP